MSDMSNEEANSERIAFGDQLSLSFDHHTHRFPMNLMHSGQHTRMHSLSSPNSADDDDDDDQVLHSTSSTQSVERNYINLDLTI